MKRQFTSLIFLALMTAVTSSVMANDVFEPWRSDAKASSSQRSYTVDPKIVATFHPWVNTKTNLIPDGVTLTKSADTSEGPSEFASYGIANKSTPADFKLPKMDLTERDGVEMTLWFRLKQTPVGKLKESVELTRVRLTGSAQPMQFVIHAYAGKPGLFLNGLIHMRKPAWEKILLQRGLISPHNALPFDQNWHEIKVVWGRGWAIVTWEDLPVARIQDPSIDYQSVTLESISPGVLFGGIDIGAVEFRRAKLTDK